MGLGGMGSVAHEVVQPIQQGGSNRQHHAFLGNNQEINDTEGRLMEQRLKDF